MNKPDEFAIKFSDQAFEIVGFITHHAREMRVVDLFWELGFVELKISAPELIPSRAIVRVKGSNTDHARNAKLNKVKTDVQTVTRMIASVRTEYRSAIENAMTPAGPAPAKTKSGKVSVGGSTK